MIIWATFALLITASPMFAWRHELRKAKKQPPVVAAEPEPRVPSQQPAPEQAYGAQAYGAHAPHAPHAAHAPQQKPSWAASSDGGNDQTMQIALGGLGGRKE